MSIATGYRYLHAAIEVIAARAPELTEVLAKGLRADWAFVCLHGTLIASDWCRAKSESGHDVWYSGKRKQHGANVQVLCDPTGYPVWLSPAEPGSTHEITCARRHTLGALYKAAADRLVTLTDKGYTEAGIGNHVPVKGRNLAADTRTRNQLIVALRAPAERGNALLTQTFKALRHVSLGSSTITGITKAGLVLLHLQRVSWSENLMTRQLNSYCTA